MEKGKKRKRNLDLPRITYHASDRTFERLFKGKVSHGCLLYHYEAHLLLEESLGEMAAVIRRKLGLLENTSLCLAQLREGKSIDLEDGKHIQSHGTFLSNVLDDDFDAFYSIAHSTSSASVRVTVVEDVTPAQKVYMHIS